MTWFLLALIANLLWSIGNFIDKVLTDRFVKGEGRALVLTLYTCLLSLCALPVIGFLHPEALTISPWHAGLFVLAGFIEMLGIIFYLKALSDDETSTVVPFFQIVPIFSLGLGFLFLGEILAQHQIIAMVGIIMGGVLLSLEFREGKRVRLKLSLVALMLASSFCYALFDALFKLGALNSDFWSGIFWQQAGIVVMGILIFIIRPACGRGFIENVRNHGRRVFSLNMLNEALYIGGMMLFAFALLFAPIALVATVNAYHPLFVFIIALLLTLFVPGLIKERMTLRHLFQKLFAILVIVLSSSYLLSGTL